MCTAKTPSYSSSSTTETEAVSPTYADAATSKSTTNTRNKTAALAGRDTKTSARGLGTAATTEKKDLLGE